MQVVRLKNGGTKRYGRALLVPNKEWKRLQKILTKKDDDRTAEEEVKRLRDEQQAISKAVAESFDNTTLVKKLILSFTIQQSNT